MSWDKFYGTERWRRRSKRQLQRVPCCERCTAQGRTQEANLAHHTQEWQPGFGVYEFWTIPLQSLCFDCHRITHNQGARKPYDKTISPDGWPADPLHPGNLALSYEERTQRNGKKR
jgi:hypothetical protein